MFSGKITMKNPTGYLDANLYGMIPFWGVMSFVYGALSTYFAFCWYKHRDQTIVMHYGIFAVLIISFTDAVSYFGTWSEGNGSGDKYVLLLYPLLCSRPPSHTYDIQYADRAVLLPPTTFSPSS